MISLHPWKKSVSLFRFWQFLVLLHAGNISLCAQQLAAYQDNQGYFYIFDNGKTIQAEYLPVRAFSIGSRCLLYMDTQNRLKMYYRGEISLLEETKVDHFEAYDYLAVYSYLNVVKIIENGQVTTITTHLI